ncbi:hypothetical protein TCAL_15079 [Tigriopus californicus]|uniref:Uncharacterized protein n=1 Tax=Tigriopus californicus TaxID=6832 RepID=A0A553NUG0_TIGCA|nr:uncharacterized protein LOC131888895 [Tigriopus californicus]TRY69071.1 hypothetical protein TCAL_15079 [Tigriopus californicus]
MGDSNNSNLTEDKLEAASESSEYDEDEDRKSQISRFLGYTPTAPPPDFRSISPSIDNKNDWRPSRRGSPKKIRVEKLNWKAEPKVQTKHENAPRLRGDSAGRAQPIYSERLQWNAQAKVDAHNPKYRRNSDSSVRTAVVFSDKKFWKASPKVDSRNPLYDTRGRKHTPDDEQWPTTPDKNMPGYDTARYEDLDEEQRRAYLGEDRESSGYHSHHDSVKLADSIHDSIENRDDERSINSEENEEEVEETVTDQSPRVSSVTSKVSSDIEDVFNQTETMTDVNLHQNIFTVQPRPLGTSMSLESSQRSFSASNSSTTMSENKLDKENDFQKSREQQDPKDSSDDGDDPCCLCPCCCCWTVRCESQKSRKKKRSSQVGVA